MAYDTKLAIAARACAYRYNSTCERRQFRGSMLNEVERVDANEQLHDSNGTSKARPF